MWPTLASELRETSGKAESRRHLIGICGGTRMCVQVNLCGLEAARQPCSTASQM